MGSIQVKQRDNSIDILKCIAALIITNSHMEVLYGDYAALATGGAIGDALFFFCSGYTLFLGRDGGFFNWYKRRINRIYPSVFAWALVAALFFSVHLDFPQVLTIGGGWFVTCIMIYYVFLWFVRRYWANRLNAIFAVVAAMVLVWYFTIGIDDGNGSNNIYGWCYFKWCHYLLFMLLGAVWGLRASGQNSSPQPWSVVRSISSLLLSTILFYALCWFKCKAGIGWDLLQISSLLPLAGVCISFCQLCKTDMMQKCYSNRFLRAFVQIVGGLCLEIYLVQYSLFTERFNHLFPLNLLIMFVIIVLVAYLLRCISRVWIQTFGDKDYDIKEIVKLY